MLLPVVQGQTLTSGIQTVVGSIPFRFLHRRTHTPWRDARTKEGYQRKPAAGRIAKLMMEIRRQRVDIPTAVLLNAADHSWKEALSIDKEGRAAFNLERYSGKFSVVDGQHRVLAFEHLYSEDKSRYGNFQLQFVLMLGANPLQELEQFYVVNSTAKSVKTDLAFDLLKQRAAHDGNIMRGLVESGQDWKVEAQSITEHMADNSGIWRRRIRLANEDKGITTIPSASFVTSLKKFLNYPLVRNLSEDKKVNIIEAYWSGIRNVMPDPFRRSDDYTLMKGIGVWSMHEILPEVIEVVRSSGDPLFEDSSYEKIMHDVLEELEGENQKADTVKGADFWLTAPKGGAAGSFSSSAGKRVLISKLLHALPEPEIE